MEFDKQQGMQVSRAWCAAEGRLEGKLVLPGTGLGTEVRAAASAHVAPSTKEAEEERRTERLVVPAVSAANVQLHRSV